MSVWPIGPPAAGERVKQQMMTAMIKLQMMSVMIKQQMIMTRMIIKQMMIIVIRGERNWSWRDQRLSSTIYSASSTPTLPRISNKSMCTLAGTVPEIFSGQSLNFKTFKEPRNRFQGINSASLCSLAGQYDNPIPAPFLALTDCLKIPALFIGLTVVYM